MKARKNNRKNPHEPGSQCSRPPASGRPGGRWRRSRGDGGSHARKAYDKALKKLHVQRVQL